MVAPNFSWKCSNPAAMRLILKTLIVSGTTLHYITTAFPSSCSVFLKKLVESRGSWQLENLHVAESQRYLTVHNGATHKLGIGFDDEVQGKPTQSDSYELLVWRSKTTDLPLLAGEDFLDIHAWWNVMVPVACNSITCFRNTFSPLFQICSLSWDTLQMYAAWSVNRSGWQRSNFTDLEWGYF